MEYLTRQDLAAWIETLPDGVLLCPDCKTELGELEGVGGTVWMCRNEMCLNEEEITQCNQEAKC